MITDAKRGSETLIRYILYLNAFLFVLSYFAGLNVKGVLIANVVLLLLHFGIKKNSENIDFKASMMGRK